MSRRGAGAILFVLAVVAGTVLDRQARARVQPREGHLLVADLHVHPFPGDGSLTIAQLQREAVRRGVDVVASTGHNNQFGLLLARVIGTIPGGPIVLPGQELTAPGFHMIAAGIERLVDWRLSASGAIAAVQAQGGVAIAAHPIGLIDAGWDAAARRALDGTEVMHPLRFGYEEGARELDAFYEAAREVNPAIAAVGSTDFHMAAPLGLCRTYILADARSAGAALEALSEGRTAAACGDGPLVGAPVHVAEVRAAIDALPPAAPPDAAEKAIAFVALIALGILAAPTRPQ